jgi:CubicO group peptidase (beta-lactamase class C family)
MRAPAALTAALVLVMGVTARAGAPFPPQPAGVPWPTLGWPVGLPAPGSDHTALETAAAQLFLPLGRGGLPDTRALLVVQGGRLVFERYAPGFGPDSRFRSWSMAKSVTQCLTGLLVREGKLSLDALAPVPAWRREGDPRGAITLRQLLNMTSGLELDDGEGDAGADSLVARLLFGDLSKDSLKAAESAELEHEPGTRWAYSTATSQLLSGIVGLSVGGGRAGVRDFAERELTRPLGIRSLVLEFDPAETMLGGSYVWASARDWARLGLLYLRDGRWEGRRILPEGWVEFTRTPAPAQNNGTYGAHFWVDTQPAEGQFPPLDSDTGAFHMGGNAGQYVAIVPARDLVVVRLGEMHVATWNELNAQMGALIRSFPLRAGGAP